MTQFSGTAAQDGLSLDSEAAVPFHEREERVEDAGRKSDTPALGEEAPLGGLEAKAIEDIDGARAS